MKEFLQCIEQSDLEVISLRFRHLTAIKDISKQITDYNSKLKPLKNWLDFEITTKKIISKSNKDSSLEKRWELFATRAAVPRKSGA